MVNMLNASYWSVYILSHMCTWVMCNTTKRPPGFVCVLVHLHVLHTFVHGCKPVCICRTRYVFVCACARVCVHACQCVHMCVHVRVYVHVCVCVCVWKVLVNHMLFSSLIWYVCRYRMNNKIYLLCFDNKNNVPTSWIHDGTKICKW